MSDDLLSGKRRVTVEEALGLMRTRMSGIYGLVDPAAPEPGQRRNANASAPSTTTATPRRTRPPGR